MSAYLRFFTKLYLKKSHLQRKPSDLPVVGYLNDVITRSIILDGRYESSELSFLGDHIFPQLKKRGVCLDIGAHIGNHSMYFSRYFDKVIAFEPHPQTFELLKINASYRSNIVPINSGCSMSNCKVLASQPDGNSGGTKIQESIDRSSSDKVVEFSLEALDEVEILRNVESIDFMKVDVKGHEYECFCGATKLLKKYSPLIVCEINADNLNNGTSSAVHILRQCGYEYMYELAEYEGQFSKLTRNLSSAIHGIITNRRLKKKLKLKITRQLTQRDHRMVFFSKELLDSG